MSVALRLSDDIDVGRGSTIVRTQNQPTVSSSFEALLCWMSEQPLDRSRRYQVKHTTRTAKVGGSRRALSHRRGDVCIATRPPTCSGSTTSDACAWS